MANYRPFAFVLMPFEKVFEDIYRLGIKEPAERLGIVAERVDEQHFSETILERIYRQIENCDFIIADMTGQNPNVFYEVGYGHAKGKLCALITQNAADIPFDLKHHPHVIYDGSIGDLREKLPSKIEWLKNEAARKKAETISVAVRTEAGFLEKDEYMHYGSFELDLELSNNSLARSPEIEAIYIKTKSDWTLKVRGEECASSRDVATNTSRHLVPPSIRRLSPNAFMQVKIEFKRCLWTKWSGNPELDEYTVKGVLAIDVVTSEGTLTFDRPIEVNFDEIPF